MANPWDDAYSRYANQARSGDITADFIRENYGGLEGMKSEKGNSFADRVIAIHQELEDQRKKYKVPISAGQIGEADTLWDTALRLAETGTDSLYDLGQRKKEGHCSKWPHHRLSWLCYCQLFGNRNSPFVSLVVLLIAASVAELVRFATIENLI
jgi:hypothetical protein